MARSRALAAALTLLCACGGGWAQDTSTSGLTAEQQAQVDQAIREYETVRREGPSWRIEAPALPPLDRTRWMAGPEELIEIQSLIEGLADLEIDLIGGGGFGDPRASFAAIVPPETPAFVRRGRKSFDNYEQVRRLVELGPKALPALLSHLDDATQTKGALNWTNVMGSLSYERELVFNTGRPQERSIRAKYQDKLLEDRTSFSAPKKHVVTIGDACFQIIGEIVNRSWVASRYQPTSCAVVNSPTYDPVIAEIVRAMWTSDDPVEMLYRSLWEDYHTRNDQPVVATGHRSVVEGAAVRLLYWFPQETTATFVAAIDALDLERRSDEVENQRIWRGFDAASFVKAILEVERVETDAAVVRLLDRTSDPSLLLAALETKRIFDAGKDRFTVRLTSIASDPSTDPWNSGKHAALSLLLRHLGEGGSATWNKAMAGGTPDERYSLLHLLAAAGGSVPWARDALATYLTDTTATSMTMGPEWDQQPLRLCDGAAQIMTMLDARFAERRPQSRKEFDALIAEMLAAARGEETPKAPTADEVADAALQGVREIKALFSFTTNESLGAVDRSSTPQAICISQYNADDPSGQRCWTLLLDGPAGKITSRMPRDCCGGEVRLNASSGGGTLALDGAGSVVVREPLTGATLRRWDFPFSVSMGMERDPKSISRFNSAAASRDGSAILALTTDDTLHHVDLGSGAVTTLWTAPEPEGDQALGRLDGWELNALEGSDLFLLEHRGFGRSPSVLYDLEKRTATPLEKMPRSGWHNGWGEWAFNIMNQTNQIWNVRTGQRVEVSFDGPSMTCLCGDPMRKIVYAFMEARGIIAAIDLNTGRTIAKMAVPRRDCGGWLTLSADGRTLYWNAQFLRDGDEPERQEGTIAAYDVSEIAAPASGGEGSASKSEASR